MHHKVGRKGGWEGLRGREQPFFLEQKKGQFVKSTNINGLFFSIVEIVITSPNIIRCRRIANWQNNMSILGFKKCVVSSIYDFITTMSVAPNTFL